MLSSFLIKLDKLEYLQEKVQKNADGQSYKFQLRRGRVSILTGNNCQLRI